MRIHQNVHFEYIHCFFKTSKNLKVLIDSLCVVVCQIRAVGWMADKFDFLLLKNFESSHYPWPIIWLREFISRIFSKSCSEQMVVYHSARCYTSGEVVKCQGFSKEQARFNFIYIGIYPWTVISNWHQTSLEAWIRSYCMSSAFLAINQRAIFWAILNYWDPTRTILPEA